jgi:hypothetical protein
LFTKGPLILSLESLFWHWQRYPKRRVAPATPPLHETARPREVEDPYRIGHGHVLRLPFTRRALVVGYWVPQLEPVLEEEENAKLLEAVEGTHIDGITATEIKLWAAARSYSWIELFMRRFPLMRRLYDRFGPSVTFPITDNFDRAVGSTQGSWTSVTEKMAEHQVTEWDGTILDLEDARVKNEAVADNFPQTQEGRAALYPEGSPMRRYHQEGW